MGWEALGVEVILKVPQVSICTTAAVLAKHGSLCITKVCVSSRFCQLLGVSLFAGVMAIPQGMSYALLARLPPQYGLYVNMIYPLIYMIFGSTQHVVVGVSAIENMLLGESVSRIIGEKEMLAEILRHQSFSASSSGNVGGIHTASGFSSPEAAIHSELFLESATTNERLLQENRIAISVSMSLCVGLVYMVMRLLSVGLVADLLASPVLSAFSTASAFLIGTSQLKHALGIKVPPEVEDGEFSVLR